MNALDFVLVGWWSRVARRATNSSGITASTHAALGFLSCWFAHVARPSPPTKDGFIASWFGEMCGADTSRFGEMCGADTSWFGEMCGAHILYTIYTHGHACMIRTNMQRISYKQGRKGGREEGRKEGRTDRKKERQNVKNKASKQANKQTSKT